MGIIHMITLDVSLSAALFTADHRLAQTFGGYNLGVSDCGALLWARL